MAHNSIELRREAERREREAAEWREKYHAVYADWQTVDADNRRLCAEIERLKTALEKAKDHLIEKSEYVDDAWWLDDWIEDNWIVSSEGDSE